MSVEIKICDIFHLQTGSTIFAGLITGKKKLLKNSKMQLLVDSQKYKTITIEGEMLMDQRHSLDLRAVSTNDTVDLTSDFIKNHDCILVEFES
ncbi:MAG: hypothetical protein AAGF83_05365 [Cyanobacteria bacterium P01_G01_bin.67]